MAYNNPHNKKKGMSSHEFFGSSIFDAKDPEPQLVAQAKQGTVRGKTIPSREKPASKGKLSLSEIARRVREAKKGIGRFFTGKTRTPTQIKAEKDYQHLYELWKNQRDSWSRTSPGRPFPRKRPVRPK